MSVRHFGPKDKGNNGVAKYSTIIDGIIDTLPKHLNNIEHFELGYTGHRELWMALSAIRKHNSKIVLTLHDPLIVTGKPFYKYLPGSFLIVKLIRKVLDVSFGKLIIREVVRKASAIIVLNPLAKPEVAKRFNVPPQKIHSLPLPPLLQSAPSANSKGFNILTFGNLSPRKGVDLLIEAFAGAFADDKRASLVVVGGCKGEEKYMQKLEAMSHGMNVAFKGSLSDNDLATDIGKANVVVLPYYDPGIIHASGPLIAAMAAGKAVVASRIPIFEGVMEDGKTGLLFEEGDASDLKIKLLELKNDQALAKRIGQAAEQHIRKYHNLDIIKKQLITTYESL